jgi:hypothetical protein
MQESDFRLHLQKGLQSQGAFAFKIPDLSVAMTKPCDLVVGLNRQLYLIECKLRKVKAKRGLVSETVVISRKDFRAHQLPTLIEAHEKKQTRSYIAACVALESMGRIIERRAWLIPAMLYKEEARDVLTIGFLENCLCELVWVPKCGWIAPWLPFPETS